MRAWSPLLIFLILVLVISVFFISGCGQKEECTQSSDCITGLPCVTERCKEGKCMREYTSDCCGNLKCEPGVGENKCTCESDCGVCGGKVKYNVSTLRGLKEKEADYARYLCVNNKCIIGVDEADVNVLRLTNDIDERNGFKADILITINNPFDTSKDKVSIEVSLKDLDTDVVDGITFTEIKVLSGSELMGRNREINKKLANVGELFIEELDLTSAQSMAEAEKSLDLEFDYEYTVVERGENVIKRSSKKNRLSNSIILVVP